MRGTRSSGHSTSAQNRPFSAIPRNSMTRTRPPGKYHPDGRDKSERHKFVINSCSTKIFMIKSGEDIRYAQDVFGCLPVADIVERRTVKFLKKYKEANDNNIVCIRY